jgi:hypothetical protein
VRGPREQELAPPQGLVPPLEMEPQQGLVPPLEMEPQQGLVPPLEMEPPQGLVPPLEMEPPQGMVPPQGLVPPQELAQLAWLRMDPLPAQQWAELPSARTRLGRAREPWVELRLRAGLRRLRRCQAC